MGYTGRSLARAHAHTHKHRKATERLTGNAITVCQGALLVCKTANFTAILQNQQVTSNHIDTLMLCLGAAPVCGCLFFFFFFGNLIRLIVYKPIQPVHRSCGPLGRGLGGVEGEGGQPPPPPPPRFVERRLSNNCVNRDQLPWHSRLSARRCDAVLFRSSGASG